jgi:hypothetical protein
MSVTLAASVPSVAWSHFNTDLAEYGSMGPELQIMVSPAFFLTMHWQESGRVLQVFFSCCPPRTTVHPLVLRMFNPVQITSFLIIQRKTLTIQISG